MKTTGGSLIKSESYITPNRTQLYIHKPFNSLPSSFVPYIYKYIYIYIYLSLQPNPLVRSSLCSQLQLQLQLLRLRHSRCETLLWFSWFFLWGLPIENSARIFFLWTMNFPIAAVSLLFHFFFFSFFCYVKYENALSFSFFNGNFADSLCGLGFCFAL